MSGYRLIAEMPWSGFVGWRYRFGRDSSARAGASNHARMRGLGPRPLRSFKRIGAQVAEELVDLARQRFRHRGQLVGG